MRLLLDSHVLLWFAQDDATLSSEVMRAIRDEASLAVVSVASVWELEMKRVKGTLDVPADMGVRLNQPASTCSTSPLLMSSVPRSFPPTTATRSIACS